MSKTTHSHLLFRILEKRWNVVQVAGSMVIESPFHLSSCIIFQSENASPTVTAANLELFYV